MEQLIRRLLVLTPALALVAGLALAARPATPSEDHSGICVGSMQIVAHGSFRAEAPMERWTDGRRTFGGVYWAFA